MEKGLFRLSISIALIGLISLYLLSGFLEIPTTKILEIEDGTVRMKGEIDAVRRFGNTTILRIHQNEYIDVKMFDARLVDVMNFSRGDRIELIGDTTEYKNKTEILASLVRKI